MPQNAVVHQGLHYLLRIIFMDSHRSTDCFDDSLQFRRQMRLKFAEDYLFAMMWAPADDGEETLC